MLRLISVTVLYFVEILYFCLFLAAAQFDFENETLVVVVFVWSVYQRETLHELIHVRGCIHAVNLWMSDNIGKTVGLCCAIGLPQVIKNSRHRLTETRLFFKLFALLPRNPVIKTVSHHLL